MSEDIKSFYEKLKVSMSYLEKLEGGVHPNNPQKVLFDKDDSENVGIVNCLIFVKNVVERVMKNPEACFEVEIVKPYSVTETSKALIPVTDEKINIKRFTEVINQTSREPGMDRIRGRDITGWLLKNGYLESVTINDHPYRIPTQKANEVGITMYQYVKGGLEYPINLYDIHAQKFIIQHLDDIINKVILEENK